MLKINPQGWDIFYENITKELPSSIIARDGYEMKLSQASLNGNSYWGYEYRGGIVYGCSVPQKGTREEKAKVVIEDLKRWIERHTDDVNVGNESIN